jgi:organic radical activating enzyme
VGADGGLRVDSQVASQVELQVDWVEMFSSFQGEGPHVGRSTLFVRLGGCDLRCAWCDSPGTWIPPTEARVETERGSGRFEKAESPIAIETLVAHLERLEAGRHRFVSLTGGEPLLQPEAVVALADAAHRLGARVLLETHGLCTEAMAAVAPHVDVVSMDWKLASDVRRASDPKGSTPEPFHDEHARFLEAARAAGEVIVKVVVTADSREEELDEVVRRLAAHPHPPVLVLQPVTPFGAVKERVDPERMLAWQRRAEERLPDVRVIPQTHKQVGVA